MSSSSRIGSTSTSQEECSPAASSLSTSCSSCHDRPMLALTRRNEQQPEQQRRRKVALGGALMVLCCSSLTNLAAASSSSSSGGRCSPSSTMGFLRPFQAPATATRRGRSVVIPPVQVSGITTAGATGPPPTPTTTTAGYVQFNHSSVAITQETSSAMPLPPSQAAARVSAMPRPANLPGLSKEDLILLRAGQRVQHQIRNGCMGSGYVVVDVLADSQAVWNTLLNFDRYAEMVPTIRKVRVTSRWRTLTKGLFTLSKFRFRLSVVHKHRPEENRLDFYLDPDSEQYRSILEMAEGFWFIDDRPADRPEGWTRVYMSATVKVNSLVPMWLVEYAAERALKRATSWLKPYVEQNRGELGRSRQ